MKIEHKVGDTVLIIGEVTGVYITNKDNKPEYNVRIKGFNMHEAFGIQVGEETIYNSGEEKRE